jgi:hypothetical protein
MNIEGEGKKSMNSEVGDRQFIDSGFVGSGNFNQNSINGNL